MPLGQWSGEAGRKIAADFSERLLQERSRWPLWLPIGLAAGIGLYFSLDREPAGWIGAMCLSFWLGCLICFRQRRWLPLVCGMAVAVSLRFTAIQLRTAAVGTEMLTRRTGAVTVTGTVVEVTRRAGRHRIIIERPAFQGSRPVPARLTRLRLSIRGQAAPAEIGSVIRVRAVLLPVPGPVAPGAYDFQRRAFYRGVGATGFAIGPVRRVSAPPSGAPAGSGSSAPAPPPPAPSPAPCLATPGRWPLRCSPASAILSARRPWLPSATLAWPIYWPYPACMWAWWWARFSSCCACSWLIGGRWRPAIRSRSGRPAARSSADCSMCCWPGRRSRPSVRF